MDIIGNKYKLGDMLGSGGYGTLFRAINIRTNEEVAVKVEPIENKTKLLKNETKIYQYLQCFCQKGIPKVLWYGSDKENYYMVMELLGSSLKDINNLNIQSIGIQILNRLEFIHSKQLIHRDVKPENFLFGISKNEDILYIIDFGFCKTYIKNGIHIQNKKRDNIIGTPNFISIRVSEGEEPSRRDDLESVVYILYYLWNGDISVNDKQLFLNKEEKIPSYMIEFFDYCRNLDFEENPNYSYLYKILERLNKCH
jgi:serine/threonine protein kinase